jgi:hypothetical protein
VAAAKAKGSYMPPLGPPNPVSLPAVSATALGSHSHNLICCLCPFRHFGRRPFCNQPAAAANIS